MNLSTKIKFAFILGIGISPITIFHQNINAFDECNIKATEFTDKYNFKLLMYFSLYSTFLVSILLLLEYIKKNIKMIEVLTSFFLTIHLITGGIIFFTFIAPDSYLLTCSKEVVIVSVICSICPEIIFICLLILGIAIGCVIIHGIFVLIKDHIIKPIVKYDIKNLCFLGLFIWNGLLIWSYISFEKYPVNFGVGTSQIIFSLFSLIIQKKYYDKLKYSLIIVIALGMSVYFIEVFKSPYGLTPFGIISFSSIGFFPVYFSLKKTKKIYKKYLSNQTLRHQEMPKEPPAICASGNIELYN